MSENTYGCLDDDVPDGSVSEGDPGRWAVGIPNQRKNDALVKVDAIVGNVAGISQ